MTVDQINKIPTILLTGFLGAGKTTLLNQLIMYYNSQKTVLLINEFGEVGIDGSRIRDGSYETIELNKGSLFCICVRTDFIKEVEKIATEIQPELLIIEATGLADTSEMEKMLGLPNIRDKIKLHTCICLVDCTTFLKIKDTLRAPITQIKNADIILLNKIDLVNENQIQQVESAVRAISSDKPLFRTSYAAFPLEVMDTIYHPDSDVSEQPGDGYPDPVLSVTISAGGSFTSATWQAFLKQIHKDLLRFKGYITLGHDTYYVDATIDRIDLTPSEKISRGKNQFVVIGKNIEKDQIKQLVASAIRE